MRNDRVITVISERQKRLVTVSEIIYAESQNREIVLHLRDQRIHFYYRMKDLEQELGAGFLRCHRSYLINLSYADRLVDEDLLLTNGERIPVPKKKRRYFRELLYEKRRQDAEGRTATA